MSASVIAKLLSKTSTSLNMTSCCVCDNTGSVEFAGTGAVDADEVDCIEGGRRCSATTCDELVVYS
jgi:hypothetical protein